VLFQKHLLLTLANAIDVGLCLLLDLSLTELLNLHVLLLLHFFSVLEDFDQFSLRLALLLNFALKAHLALLFLRDSVQSLLFVFSDLLCPPVAQLVLYLLALLR